MEDDFWMKNKYAMDDNVCFFCYSGCKTQFATDEELEKHLMREHDEATLKLWGISRPLLERKYI
jgi:hypothetical protein